MNDEQPDNQPDNKLDEVLGVGEPVDDAEEEKKHTPRRRGGSGNRQPVEHNEEEPDRDAVQDYRQVRATLHNLIDKGDEALDAIMEIAQQSDHPRAYEVVSTILKNTGDLTDKLMQLQKDRQEVTGQRKKDGDSEIPEGGQHVHLYGNTKDLMDELERRKAEKENGES